MSREQRTFILSKIAGILWMIRSRNCDSLPMRRVFSVVQDALSDYLETLHSLGGLPHCMSYEELKIRRILKEKYWKFSVFMAAVTSLPVLYKRIARSDMIRAVCAKASLATSAKLLDNLNDEVHSYQEAVRSLSEYKSALKKGVYTAEGTSSAARVEKSCCEIATWVFKVVNSGDSVAEYRKDVDLLIRGQIDSLQHKKGKYPSTREYLGRICERSIGDTWIDADLAFSAHGKPCIKEGNDYIFKSYLIYDDVQDIVGDLKTNSVNAAVILGLERGILSESDMERRNVDGIVQKLRGSDIFPDLLCLGDMVYLKGMELIAQCSNPIDKEGLAASLGMIRMFNMRRTLTREKNLKTLNLVLANPENLRKARECVPDDICEMVEYM